MDSLRNKYKTIPSLPRQANYNSDDDDDEHVTSYNQSTYPPKSHDLQLLKKRLGSPLQPVTNSRDNSVGGDPGRLSGFSKENSGVGDHTNNKRSSMADGNSDAAKMGTDAGAVDGNGSTDATKIDRNDDAADGEGSGDSTRERTTYSPLRAATERARGPPSFKSLASMSRNREFVRNRGNWTMKSMEEETRRAFDSAVDSAARDNEGDNCESHEEGQHDDTGDDDNSHTIDDNPHAIDDNPHTIDDNPRTIGDVKDSFGSFEWNEMDDDDEEEVHSLSRHMTASVLKQKEEWKRVQENANKQVESTKQMVTVTEFMIKDVHVQALDQRNDVVQLFMEWQKVKQRELKQNPNLDKAKLAVETLLTGLAEKVQKKQSNKGETAACKGEAPRESEHLEAELLQSKEHVAELTRQLADAESIHRESLHALEQRLASSLARIEELELQTTSGLSISMQGAIALSSVIVVMLALYLGTYCRV